MDNLQNLVAATKEKQEREEKNGIGTYKEKTVHAVLKQYYEPDEAYQEQRIGGYVADICRDGHIIEIQTRSFYRLKDKLEAFLALGDVTVVYPIPYMKWVIWLKDAQSKEEVSRRKSPKKGSVYDVMRELYGIKTYLSHPNFHLKLVLLNMEEYRLLNGWSHDRKRGSKRFDRIPLEIVNEITLNETADYVMLLPPELEEVFTTTDYSKAAKITIKNARTALHILAYLGVIKKVGKKGNTILYSVSDPR
ncbi:hypothetical protein lbkm_3355 [Lachnospiraceae bacterium KM106-2]|nr:hypothetical protein lbkm_3355 [Lachnospiraceae bacterium KM106-2]